MMIGSLFYNGWAALFSFAIYFVLAIQNPYAMPLTTIVASLIAAIIGFVAMFVIRYFIGYVFYTPKTLNYIEEMNDMQNNAEMLDANDNQFIPQSDRSTMEFEEEDSEEIAKAVRTMLHGQEEPVTQ
jgi:hypothetical protein